MSTQRTALLGALALLIFGAGDGSAQLPGEPPSGRCEEGRITHIFIDNHSVFDLDETEDERFDWAYRTANAIHMETRDSFILRELLFQLGDCLDRDRLAESGRLLREYPFIARADVYPVEQPDGSWHVVVDTHDEWTTNLKITASFENGFELNAVELEEGNLVGRGIEVAAFVQEKDERRDVGVSVSSPRFLDTRWDVALAGGRSRVGPFFSQELSYPFTGEYGRFAARQFISSRESFFSYEVQDDAEFGHVLVPMREERFELGGAFRVGEPGNLTLFGLGITTETLEYPDAPGGIEVAPTGSFEETRPAGPEVISAVSPQLRESTISRLNFLFGQRNIRFVQREGLDAPRGVQDVPTGVELNIALGRSIDLFGGSNSGASDDLFTRIDLFGGTVNGATVTQTAVRIEGRQVFAGAEGWRDVLAEFDTYLYWQPGDRHRHTWFGRISAAGGWTVDQPYQLTLGGFDGVRGFHSEHYPGGRRIVFSIEDRLAFDWPAPELFDFGVTLFADAGAVFAGDVPFGTDSGFQSSVGAGLRLAFPNGSATVIRADLSYPLGHGMAADHLIFRIKVGETLGILEGLDDDQITRSQRRGITREIFRDQAGR